MKLIAGLGNPGREYERTPHNVGFDLVDLLCRRLGGTWLVSGRHEALVARVFHKGEPLLLAKPQTFMNSSGRSVGALARYYRIGPSETVVALDDVELPPGRLRIRPEGGAGGHNGLASVTNALGTTAFPRVRIGVGRGKYASPTLTGHVLGRFPEAEQSIIDQVLPVAAEATLRITSEGITVAMNQYNSFNVEAKRIAAQEELKAKGQASAGKEQEAETHVEKI